VTGFAAKLAAGAFPLALEITPPRKPLAEILLRRARGLGSRADAINVIQRPGRVPSVDASAELLEAGFEPVWHLVDRGRSRADLDGARAARTSGAGDAR